MASVGMANDPGNYEPDAGYHASDLHQAHQQLANAASRYLQNGGKDPELKKIAQASAAHSGEHVVKLAKWMAKRWANSSQSE